MYIQEIKAHLVHIDRIKDDIMDLLTDEMPRSEVPDSIAIPARNRLEQQQEEVDEAFSKVAGLINRYLL